MNTIKASQIRVCLAEHDLGGRSRHEHHREEKHARGLYLAKRLSSAQNGWFGTAKRQTLSRYTIAQKGNI